MPKKATNKAPAKKAVKKAPAKAAKDFNITEAICELLIAAGPKDGNDKIEERFREKYPTIKISKPDFDRERYKAQVQLTRKKP